MARAHSSIPSSESMEYTFTIFTPCYNGAKTIQRVFDSVARQTYVNFEWIIVNDGSTDESDSVIRTLVETSPVKDKIVYISQENMGKHRTWNKVVDVAKGEFFVPADCDDSFVPCTLEFFNSKANEIAVTADDGKLESCRFSGINVCVYDPETGNPVGSPYPKDGLISDNLELNFRYKVAGEHWGCIRTDLLRKYKFPEINGHFFAETRIWYALALDGYKVLCFNEPLRAYYHEELSLCNNTGYRRDPNRAYMALHFSVWLVWRGWFRIARMDIVSAAKLLLTPAKAIVRLILCKIG